MTYQAPQGWRLSPRSGQHAAPVGSTTPLRRHARRALRLFATAGAGGAGLCLVIGLVTLVAEGGGPGVGTHVTAAAGASQLSKGAGHGRAHGNGAHDSRGLAGGTHPAGRVLYTFSGTGNRTTGAFSVAAPGRWDMQWSYQCPPHTPGGQLVIRDGGHGDGGLSVTAAGMSGHGSTSDYSTSATHDLLVLSGCSWRVKVIGSR